ncbi:MAG: hypothetical protein ACK5C5_01960 [Bacteroidota bacterium]|jgi:hypothetical protein
MKNHTSSDPVVPQGINDYIKDCFNDDFLTDIKPVIDAKGQTSWLVDVTHNSLVYHLRFNQMGALVDSQTEAISFPGDEIELGEGD